MRSVRGALRRQRLFCGNSRGRGSPRPLIQAAVGVKPPPTEDRPLQVTPTASTDSRFVRSDQRIPPRRRSELFQFGLLIRLVQPRAGQEADAFRRFDREAGSAAGHDVDDEVGVLPVFELRRAHAEGHAADFAEVHVGAAEYEFVARVAHRGAAVAAAAGLMEEQGAVFGGELGDPFERFRGGADAGNHGFSSCVGSCVIDDRAVPGMVAGAGRGRTDAGCRWL